eukprot:4108171-Pleurochrysis_carterae.AAC.2
MNQFDLCADEVSEAAAAHLPSLTYAQSKLKAGDTCAANVHASLVASASRTLRGAQPTARTKATQPQERLTDTDISRSCQRDI